MGRWQFFPWDKEVHGFLAGNAGYRGDLRCYEKEFACLLSVGGRRAASYVGEPA